jgi:hypothetical protein
LAHTAGRKLDLRAVKASLSLPQGAQAEGVA